jgi:hypothetical protein
MNLPDAPIAHEGFFVTHFLTVRDQERGICAVDRLRDLVAGTPW